MTSGADTDKRQEGAAAGAALRRKDSPRREYEHADFWESVLYRGRRSYFLGALYGALFAFFFMTGRRLEKYGSIPFADRRMWRNMLLLGVVMMLLAVTGWALCESWVYRRGEKSFRRRSRRRRTKEPHGSGAAQADGSREKASGDGPAGRMEADGAQDVAVRRRTAASRRQRLLVWGFLMLSYFVVLLAVYPGFFVYDAQEELNMVLTRQFTTHHPLAHVLLMGGTVAAVHRLTGSFNAGIFVYSLLQMAAIAGALTCVLAYLKERGLPRALRVFFLLFFAFAPPVVMFALCSCKDGIFAASLTLFTLFVLRLSRNPGWLADSAAHCIAFIAAAVLMLLFRNNALYAYLLFLPFFVFWNRQSGRKLLAALLCGAGALAAALLVSRGLVLSTGASGGEHQEILSVPIQQLARSFVYNENSFDEEERALMLALMPEENWKSYRAKLSDPVKLHFNNRVYEENRAAYQKLWLKKGLEHPMTYLNAWFMTSYGLWYTEAVIDCYRGNNVYTFTYGDSSYFGFETEQPGVRRSFLPQLERLYRFVSLDARAQKIPVLHWILSPGFLFWLLLYMVFGCIDLRRSSAARAFLMAAMVWFTVLFAPCSLPRYVIWLWLLLPLGTAELLGRRERG